MILHYYKEFIQNHTKSVDELEMQQNNSLKRLIIFCSDHVPHYQRLFKKLDISPHDINTIHDLQKLPILTKARIKSDPESFYPVNVKTKFINGSTGGSTGVPLKYRMSPECYERGVALLFKGWGKAGYRLGDRLAIIAGASLVSNRESIKKNVKDVFLNFRHFSSYGMNSNMLDRYILKMNQWKPSYLRGYASSLYLLAKHIEQNGIQIKFILKGVFSTAEVLTIRQRELIEKVFNVKVYDNYGLNDGGLSAFECNLHKGMHIDYERSILQIVNDAGKAVEDKLGRIVATSLYNYAMPFIRYDTGDVGLIDRFPCPCGDNRPLLKQIYGRTTDYLKLNDKIIGSPVLTVLMGKTNIETYQIVQTHLDEINIKYISILSKADELFIKKSFFEHVGPIKINFIKVNTTEMLTENKHKFIINEVCS